MEKSRSKRCGTQYANGEPGIRIKSSCERHSAEWPLLHKIESTRYACLSLAVRAETNADSRFVMPRACYHVRCCFDHCIKYAEAKIRNGSQDEIFEDAFSPLRERLDEQGSPRCDCAEKTTLCECI